MHFGEPFYAIHRTAGVAVGAAVGWFTLGFPEMGYAMWLGWFGGWAAAAIVKRLDKRS